MLVRERTTRVLIVDDDPGFRRAARELLLRRGYKVIGEAGTCAAALELAGTLKPDAVLADIHLPDGTGFLVATQLARKLPDAAVLLMTADANLERYPLVLSSGACGLVAKNELACTDLTRFLDRG